MLKRLVVIGISALFALVLLFLENKCSYFLGTQEATAEVKPADGTPAEGTPDAKTKPRVYDIVLKDVAGNVLQTIPSDRDDVARRLAGNAARDQRAVPIDGEVKDLGLKLSVTLKPEASEEELRSRLTAVGYKRPNPPRELFHLNSGIDISGGVEFVCRLHREDGHIVSADDEVVHILRSRLDERGLTEPQVTRLSDGSVQVVIPGGTRADAASTRKVLESTGKLEFRHVLDPYVNPRTAGNHRVYELYNDPHGDPDQQPVIKNAKGVWDINPSHDELRRRNRREIVAPEHVVGTVAPTKFYLLGPPELIGSDVANASETIHQGQLAVGIEFSALGAAKNEEFTRAAWIEQGQNGQPQTGTGRIAILFDNEVRSAPVVITPSTSSCVISGQFTHEEIEGLRTVLRGGSLDVVPEVISERVVGATLGEQTVFRTLVVRAVAFIAVVAFMWLYYRRLGTVANLCLVATGFFVLATLSVFNATITLPGFAGLVLTIGMAVDTNILIFERIREELKEDKGLKAAIAAGYDRAFLTIVDAHLTTFITAFILYWIGTGPVKGFGLTLMIGIVVNLFSGVYIGRLLTDWLCRNRQTVSMAAWVPGLRLPYIEWRWVAYAFSIVTAVAGLGWFAFGHTIRGGTFESNFDIDFTGGNAAQAVLDRPFTLDEVESRIKQAHAADPKTLNLLDPGELRMQPYYAELGGNHKASREWMFRGRDEEGGHIEAKRADVERERSEIERRIEDMRADKGAQDPEAKALEKGELAQKNTELRTLSEQISNRTEAFKSQIAKAFAGVIGNEGDEIRAAAFDGTTITLTLAVLEEPKPDQLAGIKDHLAENPRYESMQVTEAPDKQGLTIAAKLHAKPDPKAEVDLADPVTQKLRALLASSIEVSPDFNGQVAAALDLYNSASQAAAARRITVAKPFPSSEHFSGQVAGQMKWRALVAVLLSLLAILAYVAARFEFRFGIGAVVALLHDVLMTVGIISMLKIRIDLSVIAALLTIIGYSINETIVNFDRIRENLRKLGKPLAETINISLAQTMARTVLTASTVIITLIVLLLFGGDALVPFTATLLIGIVSGTYSAVFVASPLLLSFKGRIIEPSTPAGGAGGAGGDGGTPAPSTSPAVPAPG
jgi:SecD/SecF fusion protein